MHNLIETISNDDLLLEYSRNSINCNIFYFVLIYIFGKNKIYKDMYGNIVITKTFRNKTYFINSIKIEDIV